MEDLASVSSGEEFVQAIRKINGFYAVIRESRDEWFVAVDRVRSMPLFYAAHNGGLFLSDDPYWLREQTGLAEVDESARTEFLCTGYVTGSDSLVRGIRQLEAGQILRISTSRTVEVDELYCYRYTHRTGTATLEELNEEYSQVLDRVFRRLAARAGNRTLVVPLSGGYDSRLIALMLTQLGYKQVIAYSYGRSGNTEAVISKAVAERLGIPWVFISYSNEQWFQWIRSPEWTDYQTYADGLVSLQHVQDWLAVRQMKRRGMIPADSVFVPGHSADLLAGSRSRALPGLYDSRLVDENMVVESILAYHYALNDWSTEQHELYPKLREKVLKSLGPLDNFADNSSGFECWDIRERQAKFIVNSIRTYEYWGYDWWLPFWDVEYMEFWSKVPLQFRINAKLHERYVSALYAKIGGVDIRMARRNEKNATMSGVRKIARKLRVYDPLRVLHQKYMRRIEYDANPLAWYGIMTKAQFRRLYTGREHINSFLARIRTGMLTLD